MCLTGRLYSAEEAGRIGLVNRVVPHDELMREALDTARTIAANPAPQLRWIKELLTRNSTDADYNAVMLREREALRLAYATPEHAEAVRAFQEKRPPNFRAASTARS
jgi:enoyl-CoA hydratase/carnithine racemase